MAESSGWWLVASAIGRSGHRVIESEKQKAFTAKNAQGRIGQDDEG
jgi:hypothetical protein